MFELIMALIITTGAELYDSMNDRIKYIKADKHKIILIKEHYYDKNKSK